jgi:hypothetical protein
VPELTHIDVVQLLQYALFLDLLPLHLFPIIDGRLYRSPLYINNAATQRASEPRKRATSFWTHVHMGFGIAPTEG